LSAVAPRLEPQSTLDLALSFLNENAVTLGLGNNDLLDPYVTSQYSDSDTGISHIYLRQKVNGLQVADADFGIGIAADGAVISAGGGFVRDLSATLANPRTSDPIMSPIDAVRHAATALGLPLENDGTFADPVLGPTRSFTINSPTVSQDPITAQLHYVPTADGSAVMAWELIILTPDGQHWYDLSINVQDGDIVRLCDWMSDASYHALPLPSDSVQDGGFATINNPANPTASPFGWHDTNGVAGAEFTDTRGNNVDAHLDRNADNVADVSPPRPDGGASLNFDGFLFNPALDPSALLNQNSAVVNLFVMNNVLHDIHYQYGFTEAAGNFQVNNYGKGGAANDAVQADAQDGSGTNNANFGTPADGSAPRMQMYTWTSAIPDRDSDLDNGVITHEYGHGVSNRLTGGPGNPNALNTTQSGGMGEGWGDFWALMLSQRQTDTQTAGYGMATYLVNQSINGNGIRRFPYSFNMATDPLTFDAYGTSGTTSYGVTRSTEVHNSGELWCSTLWDMNWLLINKYGYDANLYTGWTATAGPGHAGNKLALRLVMDALKLQPANPSFIQARDAIIAADIALNGGNDLFEIWSAFARRGLGANAATSDGNATTITLDTSLPMLVASVVPATGAVVTSSPFSYTVNVTSAIDPLTLTAGDFKVNGNAATAFVYTPGSTSVTFTFAVDPVAAEGNHTIQISSGAFNRASDGSAVAAFSSNFYFDATPLIVTSLTPTPNSTVAVPLTTIDVNLNSAVNPSSVSKGDLSITQGTVTGFTLLNSDKTVRFTVSELTSETVLFASVAAGAFTDANGSPNSAFAGGSYTVDYSVTPFPIPLQPRTPLGSLVYDGDSHGIISPTTDLDTFTIDLDSGQTLDVIVNPLGSFRPTINVSGPGTSQFNISPATGQPAALHVVPITLAGTYSLKVGGAASTTGEYTIEVVVNFTEEAESNGGSNNNSTATAQDLSPSFINLGSGVSRALVQGQSDFVGVTEIEPNSTIEQATMVGNISSQPTNLYELSVTGALDSKAVPSDVQDYFNIGQLQIGDVISIGEYGANSGRGSNPDPLVRLYRAGDPNNFVASDDDGASASDNGGDALIYRFTIATTDTYYIRAGGFNNSTTGTYQVGVLLENVGTAPTTGGSFYAEGTLANGQISSAENASTSWRAVPNILTATGTISGAESDVFQYLIQFSAGDLVSIVTRSDSTLDPQAALLDSSGAFIAMDNGTGTFATPGGFASVYGYRIPANGAYYFRVTAAGGTTGSYTADLYWSANTGLPPLSTAKDVYSFALSAGQSAALALKNLTPGNLDITILDTGGAVVANGVVGATNFDEVVGNYVAPSAGTYYAQVNGPSGIEYQLSVITGGTIDSEANDSFAGAQLLGNGRAAFGYISGNDDWYQLSLTAGDSITLTTSTPGGGPGQFVNNLDPRIELYSPSNVLIGSDDNSAADGKNAILSKSASVTGNYRVRVIGASGSSGEYVLAATVSNAPAPKVASVVIGDGTAQRSRITSLTVNFDQVVTLPLNPADAFVLSRQGGGSVTLSAAVMNSPNTVATLTFTGGSVDFGSLADGRYTLTILSSMVTGAGGNLDGDGNNVGGDDYVLESAASPAPPTNIFRLFGDSTGDGAVTSVDFAEFRSFFGLPGPGSIFDFNGDNLTNSDDFSEFRKRFGVGI